MSKIDPKSVKLSENFRLSDFLGCHSVYVLGYANDPDTVTKSKLKEAEVLCQTLLEPVLALFGPISPCYGYISPDLSRKLVKYQDPDKPSYHRFDAGAATDVVFHEQAAAGVAPVLIAHDIDKKLPYSRMITYSESPFICLATRAEEAKSGKHRKAFYENRYTGRRGVKPQFITKSKTSEGREREHGELLQEGLEHEWQGAGYPTYHRGGLRQLQDRRTSKYTILTDFLYNDTAIREGIPNAPLLTQKCRRVFEAAGAMYDKLVEGLDVPRLSIVNGYTSPRLCHVLNIPNAWGAEDFEFTIALPSGKTAQDIYAIVGDAVIDEDKAFITVAGNP